MRTSRLAIPMLAALAACALGGARLLAVNVKQMTLPELVANADRIVRGTVIAEDGVTVAAGGSELPATHYRIRVDETLKGAAASGEVIDVRVLASPKATAAGPLRRGTILQDLPASRSGRSTCSCSRVRARPACPLPWVCARGCSNCAAAVPISRR